MTREGDSLRALCTEENTVRECYYGRTCRAVLTVGGEKGTWDILHIAIPFPPRREAEFMRRFHVRREELPAFYREFSKAVERQARLSAKMTGESDDGALRRSVTAYRSVLSFAGEEGGADIYLISEPMEPFVSSASFQETGAFLLTVNHLGIRLLQTAKSMNDRGYTMGALDLDCCWLCPEEGRTLLKDGYLLYCSDGEDRPPMATPDVADQVLPALREGTAVQSFDTDVYMIARLLWGLYDGQHYHTPADLHYEPRYAPPEIAAALGEALRGGAAAYRQLNLTLRAVNRNIEEGRQPNTFIPFAPPAFESLPLPEPRKVRTEPAVEEEGEKPEKKRPRLRLKRTVPWICAALLVPAILLPRLPGATQETKEGVLQQETGQEEQMEEQADGGPESAEQGLYVLDGMVLDRDGSRNRALYLSADGSIAVKDASGEERILFPAARCTTYVPVQAYRLETAEKEAGEENDPGEDTVQTLEIRAEPAGSTCRSFRLTELTNCTDLPETGLEGSVSEDGTARVSLHCTGTGNCFFRIESGDGRTVRSAAVSFPVRKAEQTPLPGSPSPGPVQTPPPETAAPSPVYGEAPSRAYTAETAVSCVFPACEKEPAGVPQTPVPVPVPAYEPVFTCSTDFLLLSPGQSAALYPSESCTFSPYPHGIVRVDGNTVTALSPGRCTITLTCTLAELRGQQLTVEVEVSGEVDSPGLCG